MVKLNITIFICLITWILGFKNNIEEINLINPNIEKTNYTFDSKETQQIINLLSSIPQETYNNTAYYDENSTNQINYKNKIYLLTHSEDKKVLVYGCESLDYGRRGIIINYKIDNQNHYNYFDLSWTPYYSKPSLFIYDYDNDKQEEIALHLQEATGTGINIQQLIIFEVSNTGHLEAHKFSSKEQIDEITRLIDYNVDEENRIVNLASTISEKDKILDISFKSLEEDISIENIDYSSQVTFDIDDKIIMNINLGLRIKEQVSTYYDDEQILKFYVKYNYSESTNKNYFSLELCN